MAWDVFSQQAIAKQSHWNPSLANLEARTSGRVISQSIGEGRHPPEVEGELAPDSRMQHLNLASSQRKRLHCGGPQRIDDRRSIEQLDRESGHVLHLNTVS
jgi:hypothetical protein